MLPALIVTDVDGTLLTDHNTVSDYTSRSLHCLHQLGVPIVLATGRPPRDVVDVVDLLDFDPLCVCANGAIILQPHPQQLHNIGILTAEEVLFCVSRIKASIPQAGFAVEPPELHALFYCDSHYVHPYDDPQTTLVARVEELGLEALKILVSLPGIGSAALAKIISDIVHNEFEVCFFHRVGLVEIAKKGVNKATGIEHLVRQYNLPQHNIIAFGDMNNDKEIIQAVWRGVAMGNASEELKSLTPHTTRDNNSDGIAYELSKFWPQLKQFQY